MVDNIEQLINDETEYGSCIVIRMNLSNKTGVWLPCSNGETEIIACFKKMTVEDNLIIESLSFENKTSKNGINISSSNYLIYKTLLIRRLLLKINDFVPERKNDWIIEKDWIRIKKCNAMILNTLINEYEVKLMKSEDDMKIVERQSSILFGSDNGRVLNPHPSISMYCMLGSIWEKFGLDISKLKNMSFDNYLCLKQIMSIETEQQRKKFKK